LALRQARAITLAVVEAPALGGGVGLAAACDFVLSTENASYALPELLLGLVPAMILPVLGERLGLHQAKRWAMTQAQWKAIEAKSAGLVDQLVSAERVDVELSRLLRSLLRAHVRGTVELKRLVRENEGMDITRAIEMGRDALTVLLSKPEVRRDLVAFRDFGLLPGEADT
jgi:enoyl-CoA hydratase/carnithine racemase